MNFEIKHFKILRLNDHIEDYIEFLEESKQDNFTIAQATEKVIQSLEIESIDGSGLYVQITDKFQAGIDLCQRKNWKNFNDLDEKQRLTAAKYQSSLVLIRETIAPNMQPLNEVLVSLNHLDMATKNQLIKLLRQGLEFLEYYIQSPNTTFTSFEPIKNLVKDCITFGDILNKSVSKSKENSNTKKLSRIFPIEKASTLLNILDRKEQDYRQTINAQEANRPRRGPSCCNIS